MSDALQKLKLSGTTSYLLHRLEGSVLDVGPYRITAGSLDNYDNQHPISVRNTGSLRLTIVGPLILMTLPSATLFILRAAAMPRS